MPDSFQPFEDKIRRFAQRYPEMPEQQVILTRLYYHTFLKLEAAFDRAMAPEGINTSIWMTLIMIYANPTEEIKPSDLSRVMISSRTNITRLTDALVKKGWLLRRACEQDRRVLYLSLTDQGEAVVKQVLPKMFEFYKEIWNGLSPGELETLAGLLRKLLAGIAGRDLKSDVSNEVR